MLAILTSRAECRVLDLEMINVIDPVLELT